MNGNEAYAHYYVRAANSSSGMKKRDEKIGGTQPTDISKLPFNSVAECSYDGNMYVLTSDGTIYQFIDTYQRKVYMNKDDIPKEYELSEYNIKFWQFDKNALPIWYDDYSKSIKRIVMQQA